MFGNGIKHRLLKIDFILFTSLLEDGARRADETEKRKGDAVVEMRLLNKDKMYKSAPMQHTRPNSGSVTAPMKTIID